jgi:hypothetical protein
MLYPGSQRGMTDSVVTIRRLQHTDEDGQVEDIDCAGLLESWVAEWRFVTAFRIQSPIRAPPLRTPQCVSRNLFDIKIQVQMPQCCPLKGFISCSL